MILLTPCHINTTAVSVTTFEIGLEVSFVHGPCHTDRLRPDLIVHLSVDPKLVAMAAERVNREILNKGRHLTDRGLYLSLATTFEIGLEVSFVHGPCHTDRLRPDLIVHLSVDVNCAASRSQACGHGGRESQPRNLEQG
jgi:hypothetical protein